MAKSNSRPKPKPRPKSKPRKRKKKDNCFITTACVEFYGLKDNCSQLNKLRMFRDEYLGKSIEGIELVNRYYKIAPRIVELLKRESNKEIIFEEIFSKISSACEAIDRNDFGLATIIYKEVVVSLINRFNLTSEWQ